MYFSSIPDCPDHLSKLIKNKLQSIANDPQYPASSPCASPYAELYGNWSLFLLRENWSLSCCGTPSACEGYVEATGRSCATGVVDDEACPLVDFSGFLERLIFGMTAYS
uniref:Uncharacterized protein n=1 Tax=Solanum lycopersicum TaxID=4081 RepID=K4CZN5_SOLLC